MVSFRRSLSIRRIWHWIRFIIDSQNLGIGLIIGISCGLIIGALIGSLYTIKTKNDIKDNKS